MKLSALLRHLRRYTTPTIVLLFASIVIINRANAQTGGDGAITGTVLDSTGALIPNATVTATNTATGVVTTRHTSSGGLYQLSPLSIGTYTVTIEANGFKTETQQNIVINASQVFGLNLTLQPGNTAETVTVDTAPPALDTTNAVLGGTITSKEYMELPLLVAGNQQRDVTQFSNLLPGAQPGTRSSLFSGTGNRVQEVYLDGIPISEISQIGDNRPIFNLVPSEAIDQIGVTTSGQSVEGQGAGSVNYTLSSGTNKYHGTVADFVRNTNSSCRQARRSPERVHRLSQWSNQHPASVQWARSSVLLRGLRSHAWEYSAQLLYRNGTHHTHAHGRLHRAPQRRTGQRNRSRWRQRTWVPDL